VLRQVCSQSGAAGASQQRRTFLLGWAKPAPSPSPLSTLHPPATPTHSSNTPQHHKAQHARGIAVPAAYLFVGVGKARTLPSSLSTLHPPATPAHSSNTPQQHAAQHSTAHRQQESPTCGVPFRWGGQKGMRSRSGARPVGRGRQAVGRAVCRCEDSGLFESYIAPCGSDWQSSVAEALCFGLWGRSRWDLG
jgi:hypothetical protein